MAKDGRPRTLPGVKELLTPTRSSGTEIEMDLPEYGYPTVVIADLTDAQTMVAILRRNGVRVNLRGASLESPASEA